MNSSSSLPLRGVSPCLVLAMPSLDDGSGLRLASDADSIETGTFLLDALCIEVNDVCVCCNFLQHSEMYSRLSQSSSGTSLGVCTEYTSNRARMS